VPALPRGLRLAREQKYLALCLHAVLLHKTKEAHEQLKKGGGNDRKKWGHGGVV
jgi:hypothetical protein